MNTNKGYTLIEILITLAMISVLSGIAYVSYQGYTLSVAKKDLKLNGKLFVDSVSGCVSVNGDWEITFLTPAGLPGTNKEKPCDTHDSNPEKEKGKLQSMLDFTCPPGATCFTHTNGTTHYTCLEIRKEVSGKKLQIVSRVNGEKPSEHQILCGEVSAYISLSDSTCQKNGDANLIAGGLKDDCDWK